MHVVTAIPVLEVSLVVRRNLNLDAVVIEFVLLAEDRVSLSQDPLLMAVLVCFEGDVACEGELVVRKTPNVNVVHLINSFDALQSLSNFLDIKVGWYRLKDENDALPEGEASRIEHNQRENVRAHRVEEPKLGPDINDGCGDDHTDRVKEISKNVG